MKGEQKYFLFESGIVLTNMLLEEGEITDKRGCYRDTYDQTIQSFCGKTSTQRYKHGFRMLILPVMFLMQSRNSPVLREANTNGEKKVHTVE